MSEQFTVYSLQKPKKLKFLLSTVNGQLSTGFTLIELLVVCGIMVVVGAIIFASNNKFGGQVLLQNLAYDVALSIRQAQVYGISVQRFGANNFNAGYGMHFELSNSRTYNLFADANKTGLYAVGEDVAPSPYSIGRGYYISKLCAPAGVGVGCTSGTSVLKLDIVFLRPEPDAWISASGNSCTPTNSAACQPDARIVLKSPRGDTMSIFVSANGQIAVDQVAVIAP
jgi:type II secretory pathway pseudopilin PulG